MENRMETECVMRPARLCEEACGAMEQGVKNIGARAAVHTRDTDEEVCGTAARGSGILVISHHTGYNMSRVRGRYFTADAVCYCIGRNCLHESWDWI